MFDVPSESPIFNATSEFLYHVDTDFSGQKISYPERCVPVLPGGDQSPCEILFLDAGIYWSQPKLGVECCQLIAGVGPTPRNFTNGFAWNGTGTAPDYFGAEHNTDFYISPDGTFKYWTEIAVAPVTAHHDIFFRDGSGAFWAWDHLLPQPVDQSNFALFADAATCAVPCASTLDLSLEEHQAMQKRARATNMIQLALHHAKQRHPVISEARGKVQN
jgi:hypothetical protein